MVILLEASHSKMRSKMATAAVVRQDCLEKHAVPQVGTERGILSRNTFPWIAAASEVDQGHTKAPDIIGGAQIT